ncbi:MAG: hypothetical protein IKB07_07245 [Lachnospiraceae bacterium]|nr:hypothetical protein [Lachnospiraceae bacterium]
MNEEKRFYVHLCSKEYEVSTRISFRDLRKIQEAKEDSAIDFQKTFADLVYEKIEEESKPVVDDIYSDEKLKLCAEKFVSIDSKVEEFYKVNQERMGLYEAVLTSIYEKYDEEFKELVKGLPKINNEALAGISATLNAFRQSIVKIVTSPMMENIAKIAAQVSETLGSIAVNIGEMMQNIKIPTISEERKEELRVAYRAWGSYGWTVMPDLPLSVFLDCPVDIKEANKLALSYCTNKDMEKLFDILRDMKDVKMSDLGEAIFDFKHKQYKSCALILFGLIDAKLIRLQQKDKNPNGKWRAVGQSAANKVLDNIKREQDLEKKFFLLLDYENILACLNIVFANARDFRKQPIVINRNFIDHGMMTKKVIRKDCVQLFLLFYNLLMFIDFAS